MALKSDAKFEKIYLLIYCFKNDKNLGNLDLHTQNFEKFYFDWFFLCKVYNVWTKKGQRSYLTWHWSVIKNLKKN